YTFVDLHVSTCTYSSSIFFFFFSSRRRHTRLVSDWSSDVCSSDLSASVAVRISFQQNRGNVSCTFRKVVATDFVWPPRQTRGRYNEGWILPAPPLRFC